MSRDVPDQCDRLESLVEELHEQNERLSERVETLENELQRTTDQIETLEGETDTLRRENDRLQNRVDELESKTDAISAAVDAAHKRSGANKERLEELQVRELEKGAYLQTETVDEHKLEVQGGRLERITTPTDPKSPDCSHQCS